MKLQKRNCLTGDFAVQRTKDKWPNWWFRCAEDKRETAWPVISRYGDFHYKVKTVMRSSSYLYNGSLYTVISILNHLPADGQKTTPQRTSPGQVNLEESQHTHILSHPSHYLPDHNTSPWSPFLAKIRKFHVWCWKIKVKVTSKINQNLITESIGQGHQFCQNERNPKSFSEVFAWTKVCSQQQQWYKLIQKT